MVEVLAPVADSSDSSESTLLGAERDSLRPFPVSHPLRWAFGYYARSVALSLTGRRRSPRCWSRLGSCCRCPVRRFPLRAGWLRWELCRAIVACPTTSHRGASTLPSGTPPFRHDLG